MNHTLLCVTTLFIASCSSDSPRPPIASNDGDGGTPVVMDASAFDSSTQDAGRSDSGSDGGLAIATCKGITAASWATVTLPAAGVPEGIVGFSILHDEKTIAWTETGGTIRVASRANVSQPFGAPVALPGGPYAEDKPALALDGLGLLVISNDRQSVRFFRRATLNEAFATIDDRYTKAMFAPDMSGEGIDAGTKVPPGSSLFKPVLSYNGTEAFFTIQNPNNMGLAIWTSDSEAAGAPLRPASSRSEPELGAAPIDKYRFATGISADGLTLFYLDNNTLSERMATRASLITPFVTFVDLGLRYNAAPNAACNRLYYLDGPRLVFADKL
jgi:hypothetical protein